MTVIAEFPKHITQEFVLDLLPKTIPGVMWYSTLHCASRAEALEKVPYDYKDKIIAFRTSDCHYRIISEKKRINYYRSKMCWGEWRDVWNGCAEWTDFSGNNGWQDELTAYGDQIFLPKSLMFEHLNMEFVAECLVQHHCNPIIKSAINRFKEMADEQLTDAENICLDLVLCDHVKDLLKYAKRNLNISEENSELLEKVLRRAKTL